MNLRTLKNSLLATSAVALVAFGVSNSANAIDQDVTSTFATAASLAVAAGNALDFGTWAFVRKDAEVLTITVPPTLGGGAPDMTGAVALTTDPSTDGQDSILVNTVAPATSGSLTVTAPIITTLEIQATIADFAGPELTLNNLQSDTAGDAAAAIPLAYDGTTISVAAANVAEEIAVGGDLVIAGALTDNTVYPAATITVSLRY